MIATFTIIAVQLIIFIFTAKEIFRIFNIPSLYVKPIDSSIVISKTDPLEFCRRSDLFVHNKSLYDNY